MNALSFQTKAITELIAKFKVLWNKNTNETSEIVFKSPTGSGKTFMTTSFINRINDEPDFQNVDIAYIWITFSDDLATQSLNKYREYFSGNLRNQLLTASDFSNGILKRNDILFINWQKLVSRKAENRVLRRPDDERNKKENGFYFEDLIENTQKENRQIVLIIDESHKNVTDSADRDVISKLRPRVTIKVSATPFKNTTEETEFFAKIGHGKADIIDVKREDVVKEGLIKTQIVCQTEDELRKHTTDDLDELMLELAISRREEIAAEWKRLGLNINPLVLIQLPNDDNELKAQGTPTKEEIVKNYLRKKQIPDEKIAVWLNNKVDPKMNGITENNSKVDFMLFKLAAGTGWDCPRAHILVMYREIKSSTFQTQTLGRILRMPYVSSSFQNNLLTTGYLYTNYKSNEIGIPNQDGNNKPKIFTSEIEQSVKKVLIIQNFTECLKETVTQNQEFAPHIDENIQNLISEKITDTVKNTVSILPFETDAGLKNRDEHKKTKSQIDNQIEKTNAAIKKIVSEVVTNPEVAEKIIEQTKPLVTKIQEIAKNETEQEITLDPVLVSDFLTRSDYGDIGKTTEFQKCFIQFMNEFFEIDENAILKNNGEKLKAKNVEIKTTLSEEVMANAVYYSDEKTDKDDNGKIVTMEMSANDVDKNFTWKCYEILSEQTEEDAKIGNIARSWSPFKEALRQWFTKYAFVEFGKDTDAHYRIFLNDVQKVQSVIREAITFSLKKYRPVLNKFIQNKVQNDSAKYSAPFTIKSHYAYSDDYDVYTPSSKSLVNPFYLRKEYNGRKNETDFIEYLETSPDIKSWFKNGDSGKEFFGIKYFSTKDNCYRLFYPDWIVLSTDGTIGIFDTKGGQTASSEDTKDKAEELYRRIKELNQKSTHKYIGGIVVKENNQWKINCNEKYAYNTQNLQGWKTLAWKTY